MYLLPFAERLLEFSSALSSFPGQVPTQEVNSAAEGNVLAVTPTSAMICCAESMPKPGTYASRITVS
jgi:spore coat protein U-like protein